MDIAERNVTPAAARVWWVTLIAGVAWLLIAWAVLRANMTSLATVGVLLGLVFLGAAVNEAYSAMYVEGGWKILHYVLAVILLLGAIWAFVEPVCTFFALASVLGLILFIQGIFDVTRGLAARGVDPYWWAAVLSGTLLILLAFWVSASDRVYALQRRAFLILFWVGFMALLRGINELMFAFGLRHAERMLRNAWGRTRIERYPCLTVPWPRGRTNAAAADASVAPTFTVPRSRPGRISGRSTTNAVAGRTSSGAPEIGAVARPTAMPVSRSSAAAHATNARRQRAWIGSAAGTETVPASTTSSFDRPIGPARR